MAVRHSLRLPRREYIHKRGRLCVRDSAPARQRGCVRARRHNRTTLRPPRKSSANRATKPSVWRTHTHTQTARSSSRVLEGKWRRSGSGGERGTGAGEWGRAKAAWAQSRTVRATPNQSARESGMQSRASPATGSPTLTERDTHVPCLGESVPRRRYQAKMTEELPILKGILNGVVDYHNARTCHLVQPPNNPTKTFTRTAWR